MILLTSLGACDVLVTGSRHQDLAVVPMLLSVVVAPVIEVGGRRAGIRELLRASPTGIVGMFMTLMPFNKLAMIRDPTTAPAMVPSPPIRLVPPITHAAMASNS